MLRGKAGEKKGGPVERDASDARYNKSSLYLRQAHIIIIIESLWVPGPAVEKMGARKMREIDEGLMRLQDGRTWRKLLPSTMIGY